MKCWTVMKYEVASNCLLRHDPLVKERSCCRCGGSVMFTDDKLLGRDVQYGDAVEQVTVSKKVECI
uniref:OrfB_Zn_ribbon domain-containing protein n=1 Tax=Mesocestoides corti TaxID=53468 RepID=A0A5K3FJS2_MESCO